MWLDYHIGGRPAPIRSATTSRSPAPISICIGNGRNPSLRSGRVICPEVSAQIKNLSTYAVSITKQYLLLPFLIVADAVEPSAEEPDSRDLRPGSRTEPRFINFIQSADSARWKHNLHDCRSKTFFSCSIFFHLFFFLSVWIELMVLLLFPSGL